MVVVYMDEIGFIVMYIDEDGFICFYILGGFDLKMLILQWVIVYGCKDFIGVMGSKFIYLMKLEECNKQFLISEYYIDLGMFWDEVVKYIVVGDFIM